MSDVPGKARSASHENLADKFKGAALTGLLPPRPVVEPPVEATPSGAVNPAEATPVVEEVPSAESAATRVAPTTPAARAGRPSKKEAPVSTPTVQPRPTQKADQPISINMPLSLYARLLRHKEAEHLSHPTILFNALEATAHKLPDLIRAKTGQAPEAQSLFNRPRTVALQNEADEPRGQIIVRISEVNKQVIAQLVEDAGAPSRNMLIVAAYEDYLPE